MSWWWSAHCVPKPHIAGSAKKQSNNNRPTEPHIAAFYLAIVRSSPCSPGRWFPRPNLQAKRLSALAAICDKMQFGSLR